MEAQSSTATPPAKVPKMSDKVIAQSGEPMEIAAGGTSEIDNLDRKICEIEKKIQKFEKKVEEAVDDRGKWEILMKKEEQLRTKEDRLRKEKEQLRELLLVEKKKELQLQPPSDSKRIYFQVDAKIIGAKKMKGIRAAVYRNAEEHVAMYSLNHSRSIWYDEGSEDLQIMLLFDSEARAYRFRAFLDQWYLNNPLAIKSGDVVVGKELATVHIPSGQNLIAVRLQDYVAEMSDSPLQSFVEFMTLPSSVSSEISIVSDMDDPLYKYQCLERPQEFFVTGTKPYRCHLKPRARFAKLTNEINNQLAGTWLFHQWLDGLHTFADDDDDIPILAVRPVKESIQSVYLPGPPPTTRSRVDVIIEFRESIKAEVFETRLKEGSKRIEDKKLQTFVLVSDPTIFCECLQWKYDDTIKKWNGEDEDSLC